MKLLIPALLLLPAVVAAQPVSIEGTICRMNRSVDRLIIGSDRGRRLRVAVGLVPITWRGQHFDRGDLRPGDRVYLTASRGQLHLLARSIDVTMRVDDALVDSIFRSHRTVVGRFTAREPRTNFFILHLPLDRTLRVDARAATSATGPVEVSSFREGDLLEVRGTWPARDLLRATTVNVITDREPSFCTVQARRDEIDAETASREAREQLFLDKEDN